MFAHGSGNVCPSPASPLPSVPPTPSGLWYNRPLRSGAGQHAGLPMAQHREQSSLPGRPPTPPKSVDHYSIQTGEPYFMEDICLPTCSQSQGGI